MVDNSSSTSNNRLLSILSKTTRVAIRLPTLLILGIIEATSASDSSRPKPKTLITRLTGYPPPPLETSRSETAWLDGLRGFAAFLVMAFHYNMHFLGFYLEAPYGATLQPQNQTTYALWRLPLIRFFLASGHTQVSVFFVLSGFVLSWGALGRIREGQSEKLLGSLSSAVVRRWMRLYLPCFFVGIIAMEAVRTGYSSPPGAEVSSNVFVQFWDYIWAFERFSRPLMRDRKFPNWLFKYDWVMWTIPIEFEGSLLVFFMLLAMARMRRFMSRSLVMLGISTYACVLGYWTYWLFATGMLIADYVRHYGGFQALTKQTTASGRIFCWILLVIALWLGGIPVRNPTFYDRPGYDWIDSITPVSYAEEESGARFWWCIAGIFILISGSHLRPIQVLCESSPARYLGRISFMLYLSHSGLIMIGVVTFRRWFTSIYGTEVGKDGLKQPIYEFSFLASIVLYCASWVLGGGPAIILAHWLEILVDGPSVRFAKWVESVLIASDSSSTTNTMSSVSTSRGAEEGTEMESAGLLPVYRADGAG